MKQLKVFLLLPMAVLPWACGGNDNPASPNNPPTATFTPVLCMNASNTPCTSTATATRTATRTPTSTPASPTLTPTPSATATPIILSPSAVISGIFDPLCVAVDGAGNVYATQDMNYGTAVQEFVWNGSGYNSPLTLVNGYAAQRYALGGTNGAGLAVNSAGTTLYVVDGGTNKVNIFYNPGSGFVTVGQLSGFSLPMALSLDAAGNYLYVSDHNSNTVTKFTSAGVSVTQWGGLTTPLGVAAAGATAVFEVDQGTDHVLGFSTAGVSLLGWGGAGSQPGKFTNPTYLAVDGFNHVFVADSYNQRIQEFDLSGNSLTQFGSLGSSNGYFNYPFGIAADSAGNLYVADYYNNRIQKFGAASILVPTATPTSTSTPLPSCLNGYTSPDTTHAFNTSTYLIGYPVTLSAPTTIYQFLVSMGSPVSGNVVLGLYSNSTGPASLQASATIASPVASSVNAVNITPMVLPAAIYWMVTSTQSGPFNFAQQTAGGGYTTTEWYLGSAYTGSLPGSLAGTGSLTTSSPFAVYWNTCP